jgi:hypothetical protein
VDPIAAKNVTDGWGDDDIDIATPSPKPIDGWGDDDIELSASPPASDAQSSLVAPSTSTEVTSILPLSLAPKVEMSQVSIDGWGDDDIDFSSQRTSPVTTVGRGPGAKNVVDAANNGPVPSIASSFDGWGNDEDESVAAPSTSVKPSLFGAVINSLGAIAAPAPAVLRSALDRLTEPEKAAAPLGSVARFGMSIFSAFDAAATALAAAAEEAEAQAERESKEAAARISVPSALPKSAGGWDDLLADLERDG